MPLMAEVIKLPLWLIVSGLIFDAAFPDLLLEVRLFFGGPALFSSSIVAVVMSTFRCLAFKGG